MANANRSTRKISDFNAPSSFVLGSKSPVTETIPTTTSVKVKKASKVFTKRNAKIAGVTVGAAAVATAVVLVVKNPALAAQAGAAITKGAGLAKGKVVTFATSEAVKEATIGVAKRTASIHVSSSLIGAGIQTGMDAYIADTKFTKKQIAVAAKKHFKENITSGTGMVTALGFGVLPVSKIAGLGIFGAQIGVGVYQSREAINKITEVATEMMASKESVASEGEADSVYPVDFDPDFDWASYGDARATLSFEKYVGDIAKKTPLSEELTKSKDVRNANDSDIWVMATNYVANNVKSGESTEEVRENLIKDLTDMLEVGKATGDKFAESFVDHVVIIHQVNNASA